MSWRLTPRSSRRGDLRWWISLAAISGLAAGMAYLFDPREGRGRRNRMSQRMTRVFKAANQRLRHLVAGGPPAAIEGPAPLSDSWPEEPPPDVDSEDAVAVAALKES